LGFIARNSGVSVPPKAPPTSSRRCGSSSSATAHMTGCTLPEVARPWIVSIFRSVRERGRGRGSAGRRGRRGFGRVPQAAVSVGCPGRQFQSGAAGGTVSVGRRGRRGGDVGGAELRVVV